MGFEIKTSSGHTIKSNSAALEIFEDGLNELLSPLEIENENGAGSYIEQHEKELAYNHRRSRSIANKPHSRDMFFIQSKKVITGANIGLKVSINNNAQYTFMIKTSKSFYLKQRIIVWFHWDKVNMRFQNSYLIQ